MRREISDTDCLRYWERRLAEHQAMRPVTDAERAAIVAEHRARAASLRDTATRMHVQPPPADAYGRGPTVPAERHANVVACVHLRRQAHRCEQLARHEDLVADAWEVASYAATLAELEGRVAYYRARAASTPARRTAERDVTVRRES